MADGAYSSAIDPKTMESPFDYIIQTIDMTNTIRPKNVLVIGTAWFTFPQQIAQFPYIEQIDAVDIDPSVYKVAQDHFLQQPISKKITFYPQSARFFLRKAAEENKTYDLIFVDAYNGKSLPDELTTTEFFEDLKRLSANNQIVFNFILDRKFESNLAKSLLLTAQNVFGELYYRYASQNQNDITNVLFTTSRILPKDLAYKPVSTASTALYTDNKRATEINLAQLFRFRK